MKPLQAALMAALLPALVPAVQAAGPAAPAATPLASLSQPSLSPDASRIAFVANSAIWTVPAAGGAAHLLVADGGNDSRPLYSPDGTRLAFVSDATGNGDIYVLDLASGALSRITWADGGEQLSAWSHDGRWLYFSSSHDNVGGMHGLFRVASSGGTPMPVSLEPYRNEEQGVPSPDGSQIALVGGMGNFQWWRHGHAHIDESAIWLLRNDGSHQYTALSPDDARAAWPMWTPDGGSLYYMSDRGGTENLWHLQLDGSQTQLTHFSDGRLMWPSISADGHAIAFERDFGIWLADTATGKARALPITLSGAVRGPGIVHKKLTRHFEGLRVSPDGKKLAFVVHGEVFAADADKGGEADRVTRTPGAEYGIAWAPDSRHIVYGAARDGGRHLHEYDFRSGHERQLTSGDGEDTAASFSPDGKSLAFVRDGSELCVLDLASGTLRTLVTGHIDLRRPLGSDRELAWSPDGKWIAYTAWGQRMYRNASAVRVADGHVVAASQLANAFSGDVNWSDDGKALLFVTSQRTKQGRVARVDLVPRTPTFREDQFHDLFTEATPKPSPDQHDSGEQDGDRAARDKKTKVTPVRIDADGIRDRLSLLPIGLDVQSALVSPDGKTLLVTAQVAGKPNLYAWSLDPLAKKTPVARQLTSSPGYKSDAGFSKDGKTVFYLDDGRIHSVALKKGSKAKSLDVSAQMDVDFDREKMVVFNQAWSWLLDNFHDPKMHGVDWQAVHAKYAPRIAGAATPAAMRRILNLMVGELNASHSGVRSGDKPDYNTGHLGLRFDPRAYEKSGELRIAGIVPLSPADVSGTIHVGDVLLAVDGHGIGRHDNLARTLDHRVGRKTSLGIRDRNGRVHTVDVKPIDTRAAADLAYAAWTRSNRAYVDRASHGRLGYVHLRDMSMDSLRRFYRDLDAQNSTREGVVIDERNNFGGFVNAFALDVLARRPYLNMTFRGFDKPGPARSINGQRALERPTVLLTNRVTLSDGEDFAQGYRALGLGKVVGEPTAGWIIYTSNMRMIDGSVVRLPFITVTDTNGKPMELHPRPVDVAVTRAPGESYRGVDSQLDAAVSTLLQQIDAQ
ncbi:MAG TPA: LpqB family beta-propeller domain-containing protein [Rhodanobacteraceae bacterium]|nr:LpqB family beta-propeller domain-containing protein [Rhodanobacteraceae bacterium]